MSLYLLIQLQILIARLHSQTHMNVGGTPPGQSASDESDTGETSRGQNEGTILAQLFKVLKEACGLHSLMSLAGSTLGIPYHIQHDHSNYTQYGRYTQSPAPVVGQGGSL